MAAERQQVVVLSFSVRRDLFSCGMIIMKRHRTIASRRSRGFTLLEVLLAVAVMTGIFSVGVPVYQSFQVRNDVATARDMFVKSARRAQLLARASDGDAEWGIHTEPGSITLFRGSSYAARDASFDEMWAIPTSIMPSGLSEIVFEKLSGRPLSAGAVVFGTSIGETRVVSINEKGMIE